MSKERQKQMVADIDTRIQKLIDKSDGLTGEALSTVIDQITGLTDVRNELLLAGRENRSVDPNTVFAGGVSLVSLLLILGYEKLDIITTKGWSVVQRMIGNV